MEAKHKMHLPPFKKSHLEKLSNSLSVRWAENIFTDLPCLLSDGEDVDGFNSPSMLSRLH